MADEKKCPAFCITSEGMDYLESSSSTMVLFCFLIIKSIYKSQTVISIDYGHAEKFLGVPYPLARELIEKFIEVGYLRAENLPENPFLPSNHEGLYSEEMKSFDDFDDSHSGLGGISK